MLRLLNRYVTRSGKSVCLSRNVQTAPSAFCLKWERAEFNGVDVNLAQLGENCSLDEFNARLKGIRILPVLNMSSPRFESKPTSTVRTVLLFPNYIKYVEFDRASPQLQKGVDESVLHWRRDAKKSVWMKVPISQSYLIPVAFAHGFSYHHAVGDYAMLLKWLPQRVACKVPPYATHQVGVAGMVLNEEKGEVLVVQDRQLYKIGQKRKAVWKFPGGLSDEGENLEETAIREVYEETGVKSEFKSVMMFRQQHQMKNAFDKSDIYIICRMSPLSYGISHCEDEIARCEWMKLSTLITHTDAGPITRLAARLAVYGMKNGFQNVDLEPNRMRSWVDPNKTVCLYHRYLPS